MKHNVYIHLLYTIFITGISFVINYGINLVLTPYIMNNVGAEAYGFVSLAKQFAQYASIVTLALNSFAARYIAVEYHRENKVRSNVFFSSVFGGDLILATVIFLAAIACIAVLENIINIPENLLHDVKYLFLFVFINFWITTVFTVFNSAAVVADKLNIVGVFKGVSYIFEALVLYIIYVLFPAKIFFVGIGLIAASLVVSISNYWITRKYTPELRIIKKCISLQAIKRLVLDGVWTSLNSLGSILNDGLDLIVCNFLLSPLDMSQVAVAKTINSIFQSLYQMVAQAFQPTFLKNYAENELKKLITNLKMSMKLSGLFSNLAFAGFIALGLVYYKLWIPEQNIYVIYKLTIITILTSVSGGSMTPLYYIYTLTTKKAVPCFVTILGGLLNVLGMYLLITYTDLGGYAIVWTTAIIMSVINFVTNPLYMAYSLKIAWYTFYPNIIRNVLSCSILVIVFKGFTLLYMPHSWISLIICVLIYGVIGVVLHLGVVLEKGDWIKIKEYFVLKKA